MAALPRLLAPLLIVALALAGCSGKGGGGTSSSSSSSAMVSASMSASMSMSSSPPAGSSSSSSSSTAPAGPQTIAKDIVDNNFPDGTFTIHVGDTVTWTHKGTAPHSVSADAFDSNPNCSSATSAIPGNCLKGGDTFSHKFDAAGTFAYHCRVHGSMTGTITVVA